MRGLAIIGDRQVELVEVPDPTPGPGEVILEMKASGICGTDLHFYRAPKGTSRAAPGSTKQEVETGPIIAGHEPCGVVAAVGPGVTPRQAKPGDRVMVHHYWGCGGCWHCRTGWSQMCETKDIIAYGMNAHGGHAPYLKVPAATLVPLPGEVSFEAGAAISCGTGTSFQALKRIEVTGGDTIAIFGQGPVGLAATQLARAMGARVIAIDPSSERLALAKKLGATDTVRSGDDTVARIRELTRGRGVERVLEASGAVEARNAAVRCVRPWGAVAFVGAGKDATVDLAPLMPSQITLIGSWTFSNVGQAECARFIAERGVQAEAIFTERWRLDQGADAYRMVDEQSSGKGVFLL